MEESKHVFRETLGRRRRRVGVRYGEGVDHEVGPGVLGGCQLGLTSTRERRYGNVSY